MSNTASEIGSVEKRFSTGALQGNADTARIPMLVIAAIKITAQERAALGSNLGKIIHVVEKSTFNRWEFIAEVRRVATKLEDDSWPRYWSLKTIRQT